MEYPVQLTLTQRLQYDLSVVLSCDPRLILRVEVLGISSVTMSSWEILVLFRRFESGTILARVLGKDIGMELVNSAYQAGDSTYQTWNLFNFTLQPAEDKSRELKVIEPPQRKIEV